MVKLNKIYTRTGDDGTTGLVRGPRRKKHDMRVEAYGTVDETNAFLGTARAAGATKEMDDVLARIQNDLFDVGSDLATPGNDEGQEYPALRATHEQVTWLEEQIDHFNEKLEPLKSFVLPGGSTLAAHLHAARAISRRAERITAALIDIEPETNIVTMHYLNRLSDLLFVLARIANDNGKADVLWTPGQYTGTQKEQ